MGMVMDPRCGRKTKHNHAEILICLVAGFLAGRNSIRRCLKWCENHKDFLKQNMKLENGMASPATVSRILGNIDEEMFGLVLIEWMTGILSTKGINIAIDGKALRGSMERLYITCCGLPSAGRTKNQVQPKCETNSAMT